MLEGLEGKGDENADGFVDILELHHYVTPRVQKWAFHNQKVQTPVIDAKFSGILALTKAAVSAETSSSSIGKSEVTGVTLVTGFEEMKLRDYELGLGESTLESLNEDIGRIRANLLLDFKPSQFNEEGDRTSFPAGWMELKRIRNEYRDLAKFRIELNLDYSKKNREVTDRILNRLDDFASFWTGIGFNVKGSEFDLDKLAQICTDKKYEVKKFQKKPQYFEVEVADWTNQLLRFRFLADDSPFIGVESAISSTLLTGFYTILNPTNILEVFKSALVPK